MDKATIEKILKRAPQFAIYEEVRNILVEWDIDYDESIPTMDQLSPELLTAFGAFIAICDYVCEDLGVGGDEAAEHLRKLLQAWQKHNGVDVLTHS
jgi:hypothetical protein